MILTQQYFSHMYFKFYYSFFRKKEVFVLEILSNENSAILSIIINFAYTASVIEFLHEHRADISSLNFIHYVFVSFCWCIYIGEKMLPAIPTIFYGAPITSRTQYSGSICAPDCHIFATQTSPNCWNFVFSYYVHCKCFKTRCFLHFIIDFERNTIKPISLLDQNPTFAEKKVLKAQNVITYIKKERCQQISTLFLCWIKIFSWN